METLKNIRGIFLDLGGTLLYPPSGSFSFSDFAKPYFPGDKLRALPPEQVRAAGNRARQALENQALVLTMEEEYGIFLRYYTMLSQALSLDLSDDVLRAITDDKVYNKVDNMRLFDDTMETLQALSGKYKLGIISDTWPSIMPELEYLGILPYFHCATFSYQLGTLKPDPKMYQDALAKMGLPPEQTLFVDDNLKNLEGAAALGIVPVQICAGEWSPSLDKVFGIDRLQATGQPEPEPAPLSIGAIRKISRISQLLNILEEEKP
ncbi:HAD family hydrolase [Acutalibacter caecimuris]|uniref:HAD family hydrolase n=1 Tax=Acutalibacter caecimuris TaxID=3093657 RepID=UPI002AC9E3D8|nr:HAD family hydrolase [Acutalibacter sp. M00118]